MGKVNNGIRENLVVSFLQTHVIDLNFTVYHFKIETKKN